MNNDKILIFRNQGLGDLMLITPAIRAIRELHPQAKISLFVGDWSKSAIEGNPHIDNIISYPDPWIQNKKPIRILQLVNRIRKVGFQRVYIFHSHNMLHLMVHLAGIPERFGFSFQSTGKLLTYRTEWQPNTSRYIADNYLDIPRMAGFNGDDLSLDLFISPEDEGRAREILKNNNLKSSRFFVVAPGGGINPRQNVFEKRWGEDQFAEFTNSIIDKFGEYVILVGSMAEKPICRKIVASCRKKVLDFCGLINFKVSSALVKYSRMLICNDSSIMHSAVAFKVPSLAIFGPSNPYALLPQNGLNRWISAGIDCSPCYCNSIFDGCKKDLACMKKLSADKVFNVLLESVKV
jgi:heptosyltransferase-2